MKTSKLVQEQLSNSPIQLMLPGEEDGRRGSKKAVASSKCVITFETEEDLQKCLHEIALSDEKLKKRPQEEMQYDWQLTFRSGMSLIFGVSWYEKEFYEAKKDAFMDERHIRQYAGFNTTLSNIEVSHFVLDN